MTFEKPRILTDSESNTIRGKMLVGAATPNEQLLLVGHYDILTDKYRSALETIRGCMADRLFVFGSNGERWSESEPEHGTEYEVVDFPDLLGD